MNDRFNFRIWNKQENKYLDGIFAVARSGRLIIDLDILQDYDYSNDYIIEQCTGLKDKNGKLIYIGDIIKCDNDPLNTATVEYANGENFIDGIYPFNLYHDCGDECHCQLRDYPEYACEIIGNIHEQAEQKD